MANRLQYRNSQKNKLCFGKLVILGIVLLSLAVLLIAGVSFAGRSNTAKQVRLHNPVVDMDAMCAGQKVTWNCVWFGSYPQTEVKSTDGEYDALQKAEGWDDNGDTVVDGTKYRRMKKGDAMYAESRHAYYEWEDDTTYHYFRYEPVKWRVMKADGNRAMLLSDMVLDDRKYNTEHEDLTWETSTIRSWLNGYGADANQEGISYIGSNFIDSAFTAEEKAAIADTDVINDDNLEYGTEGGNTATDKIFLLSESEIYTDAAFGYGFVKSAYTYDEARRCKGSDYAKAMGVTEAEGNCWWWLRSPGIHSNIAADVNNYGYVSGYGSDVCYGGNGVRVALNLNIMSHNPYSYAGTVCSDGTVNEGIIQKETISNPSIAEATDAQNGQNVKYDCVCFGSYPQAEVKNTDSGYAVLQDEEGWDENGVAVINGTKYRRLCKSDVANSGSYDWEDDTAYRYFKYEPVKWRVLKIDGNKAMLLSDMLLDSMQYNTEYKADVTWEKSTIRSWLNGYGADVNREGIDYSSNNFADSAFTEEEKAAIAETNVINNDNMIGGTEGGNDTNDKLFLLSESEVYTKEARAFGFSPVSSVEDISKRCRSSDYANVMGASDGYCCWWLRSPGCYSFDVSFVYSCGDIHSDVLYANCCNYGGVRVALNLDLASSNLYTYAGTVRSDGAVKEPNTEEHTTK